MMIPAAAHFQFPAFRWWKRLRLPQPPCLESGEPPSCLRTGADDFFKMTVAPQCPGPSAGGSICPSQDAQSELEMAVPSSVHRSPVLNIALLTAGRDRPYALGLASALAAAGAEFDFIGSDEVDSPELHQSAQIRFLNLRGEQSVQAGLPKKMARVLAYYARLMGYAFTAR